VLVTFYQFPGGGGKGVKGEGEGGGKGGGVVGELNSKVFSREY
jgi:hypothetical protein